MDIELRAKYQGNHFFFFFPIKSENKDLLRKKRDNHYTLFRGIADLLYLFTLGMSRRA